MKLENNNLFDGHEQLIEYLAENKHLFQTPEVLIWRKDSKFAYNSIQNLLNKAKFLEGNPLDEDTIDLIMKHLRIFSHNQGMTYQLYQKNGLEEFNTKLRNLFTNENILEAIDLFIDLVGVGFQVTAQLLFGFNQRKFPLITEFMTKIIEIPSEVYLKAKAIVLQEIEDLSLSIKHRRTIEYLTYLLIFKEISTRLKFNQGNDLNILLWEMQPDIDEKEDSPLLMSDSISQNDVFHTNLAYEKQLRDFLYEHPDYIEEGLTFLGKEYSAGDAGIIDLFGKDKDGNYVVIELKRRKGKDAIFGQILGYIGWVRKNKKGNVRGIIIIHEKSKRLDYVLEVLNGLVKVLYYRVSFQLAESLEEFEGRK